MTFMPSTSTECATAFSVTLRDGSVERVERADAYEPERTMTTFFRTDGRPTVDCWSVRVASFRTDQILAVRRLDAPASGGLGEVDGERALRAV